MRNLDLSEIIVTEPEVEQKRRNPQLFNAHSRLSKRKPSVRPTNSLEVKAEHVRLKNDTRDQMTTLFDDLFAENPDCYPVETFDQHTPHISKIWPNFIDKKVRIDNETVLFRRMILKAVQERSHINMIDLCSGIGIEATLLAHIMDKDYPNTAYKLFANELSDELAAQGAQNFIESGKGNIRTIQCDWRKGISVYKKHSDQEFLENYFDIALNLGNSMGFLLERDERRLALKNFYRQLARGGQILIDERNPAAIEAYLHSDGQAIVSSYPMYSGEKIQTRLIDKDQRTYTLGYQHVDYHDTAALQMAILKPGELLADIIDAGFNPKDIKILIDFKKLYKPVYSLSQYDGNFIQYLAKKS